MAGIEVVGEMAISESGAIQTWRKKERAFRARFEDDDNIAVSVVLNCAFDVFGEEDKGRVAVESVRRQIAAESFVNGDENANRVEGVAAEVGEIVFVGDVRTLQDTFPDISQHFDLFTGR